MIISEKIKGALNYSLLWVFNRRELDPREALLVSGSPRSGTTWLGEILAAERDVCLVTEPLHLRVRAAKRVGLRWSTYVRDEQEWPELKLWIEHLMNGSALTPGMLRNNSVLSAMRCKHLVIKEVRSNKLLSWLGRNCMTKAIVYIHRHPCAVLASYAKDPRFNRFKFDRFTDDENALMDDFFPTVHKSLFDTELKIRAAKWALDQVIPLSMVEEGKVHQIAYEDLVVKGESVLSSFYRSIGRVVPEAAIEALHKNSQEKRTWSTNHESATIEQRLGCWKSQMKTDDVESILQVVELFGIRGYGHALMPEKVTFQPPHPI